MNVQTVTVDVRPMRPGDLFKDAEGVLWVALFDSNYPADPTHATLVWHTDVATTSHEGTSTIDMLALTEPFTLVLALNEVK